GERLQRAIESHRAIAVAAWEAYEQERQTERDILAGKYDHIRRRTLRRVRGRRPPGAGETAGETAGEMTGDAADERTAASVADDALAEEYERPRHTSQAARYLAIALNAQREVAHLQGLCGEVEEPLPPAQIIIARRPNGPENIPPPFPDEEDGDEE
ncbi:MAG: hypothetical protein ACHQ4H_16005, partial [Ktedonobacterales bacterium]